MQTIRSPRFGNIEMIAPSPLGGSHNVDGMLIVAGPAFDSEDHGQEISVLDIAPTIATIHGIEDLGCYDGRPMVISDCFVSTGL